MPWVPVPHAVSSQNLRTKLSTEADRGMVRGGRCARGLVETQLEMLTLSLPQPQRRPARVLWQCWSMLQPPMLGQAVTRKKCRADTGCGCRAPASIFLDCCGLFPRTGSRTTQPEGDTPGCGCIYANGVLPCGHCESASQPQHMCGPLGEALPGLVLLCSFLHSQVGTVQRGKN